MSLFASAQICPTERLASKPGADGTLTQAANLDHALDPGICWQAIYSRDPRFDGRFFAGAKTTELYCRNVCPVPFAKPENVRLFACSAAAESAGFRPCKRCRPQASPGTPAWTGTSAVVSRAYRLIMEGALNEGSVENLAERLGLGSRQLRRLFLQHLGASPLKIATTRRLHLARALIDESKLSMTRIAFCSGFNSIREFNHAVRMSSGQSPSQLRRAAGASHTRLFSQGLQLRLSYRRPFDWASMIAFLKPRAIPDVEYVADGSYRRTIAIGGVTGVLTVTPEETASQLMVHLDIGSHQGLAETVERIRRMFDVSADPVQIATHLSGDPHLRHLVALHPGLRVPGAWDGFEVAVQAILGQTLTNFGTRESVTRLVSTFGMPLSGSVRGLKYLFPLPETLATADLARAGISGGTADTLRRLSTSIVQGQFSFATFNDLEQTVSRLEAACGITSSMAHYIAMRAFGEPDAFPVSEVERTQTLGGSNSTGYAAGILDTANLWRPWRSYAAMHLSHSPQ